MKKKLLLLLPFFIMPVFIPIYVILDGALLVNIFGCGCVPDTQTNMLGIAYNANDLRLTVFSVLTILLAVLGIRLSKAFQNTVVRIIYCAAAVLLNMVLAVWVCRAFMWA